MHTLPRRAPLPLPRRSRAALPLSRRHTGFAATLLMAAGTLPAQVPAHSLARINDSRSHGTVGDNLLSLNEAIKLNNLSLSLSQLSPAELQQVWGFGDVAFCEIDAAQVPTLTLERDLDVIVLDPFQHGFVVAGVNGTPTIDLGTTRGFVANSDFCDWRNLRLKGGTTAITVHQNDGLFGSLIEQVTFEGQTTAGLLVTMLPAAGESRLQVQNCTFTNVPHPIRIDDTGDGRRATVFLTDLHVVGGQHAIDVQLGPNGEADWIVERVDIRNALQGFTFTRSAPNASRRIGLDVLGLTVRGGDTGFTFAGHSGSVSTLQLRMLDLDGRVTALAVGPLGTEQQTLIQEARLGGPASLASGQTRAIDVQNLRQATGSLQLGAASASVTVNDSRLDAAAISSQGTSTIRIGGSCLLGGQLTGQATAPILVDGSHLGGTTVGAHVTVTNALPNPQLGSLDVIPQRVGIGNTLMLHTDLPPKLVGFWIVGRATLQPRIGPPPFHFYFDLPSAVVLPAPVRGTGQLPVRVPADASMRGMVFTFQMAIVPESGLAAPPLSLPPGRFVVIE